MTILIPAAEAAARVCHEEQMDIWTDEIAGRLSMGGYFREDWSYEDTLSVHDAIADELRKIIESAFRHPELSDEPTITARWLPIASAPSDRPFVARMPTKHLEGGWFVATIDRAGPEDESRFAGTSTIYNYNGYPLLTRFHGGWTDWLSDTIASPAPAPEQGEG